MVTIFYQLNHTVCVIFLQHLNVKLLKYVSIIFLALDRINNDYIKRPHSIGSSSGCCSDSYDPLPNQHPVTSNESYDVPRPVNLQITPSSSISSLSTGGICSSVSGSESNRSSVTPDYDVPKNRMLAALPYEFQNLSITNQVQIQLLFIRNKIVL